MALMKHTVVYPTSLDGSELIHDLHGFYHPRFQESCHPSDQYTRGLEDMTNASLQRGRQG